MVVRFIQVDTSKAWQEWAVESPKTGNRAAVVGRIDDRRASGVVPLPDVHNRDGCRDCFVS